MIDDDPTDAVDPLAKRLGTLAPWSSDGKRVLERPAFVVLYDDALGVRGQIKKAVAERLGLGPFEPSGPVPPEAKTEEWRVHHDVAACTAPYCLVCAVLLCPDDDQKHLSVDGCPWAGCARFAPHVLALREARIEVTTAAGNQLAREREVVDAARAEIAAGIPAEITAAIATTLAYLQGLDAGSRLVAEDIAGVSQRLPGIEMPIAILLDTVRILSGEPEPEPEPPYPWHAAGCNLDHTHIAPQGCAHHVKRVSPDSSPSRPDASASGDSAAAPGPAGNGGAIHPEHADRSTP